MATTVVRVNKISTVLLFAFWCSFTGAFCQDIDRKLSVSFYRDPLVKVLGYLTEHESLQFSYSKEQILLDTKITLIADDITVKELLSEICDQASLEYKFIDGLVVIRKKIASTTFVKSSNDFANFKGIVLDSASNQPLPFANVFFDNSSFGVTTDSLGKFSLHNVPIELHRLVVSYVGYRTLMTIVNLKPGVDLQMFIKLQPAAKQLVDVVITGKRDKTWTEDYELFKAEILGRTINARLCTIQNPSAVQLKRTKVNSRIEGRAVSIQTMDVRTSHVKKTYYVLTGGTKEPLEIDNRALGYRMKVLIEGFHSCNDSSSFLFYIHYDTLQASSESERFRWELNRLNAYNGSQMHLFRSILHNQMEQEGFEVCAQNGTVLQILPSGRITLQPIYESSSLGTNASEVEGSRKQAVISNGQYLVRYNRVLTHKNSNELSFASSTIDVKKSLTIDANGVPTTSSDYWRSGYFDEQRIADRLPNDYDEVKSRAKILAFEAKRIGDIRVVIIDDVTGRPISNALAFINESSIKMQSNKTGKVFFRNIPKGTHDVVFFKAGYKLAHAKLIATSINRTDTIRLAEDSFDDLNEVDDRIRYIYLGKFQKKILGGYEHRKIENSDEIRITEINKDSALFWSLTPIKIIDRRLGYRVNVFLDEPGYCYFEDLKGEQENIGLEAKRLAVYEGSFLNFSRSLIDGRIGEEGFKLYGVKSGELSKKRIHRQELNFENLKLRKDSIGLMLKFPSAIEIDYRLPHAAKTRVSAFTPNQEIIVITDYGIALPAKAWHVKGDMEEKGLIPRLPINFKPYKGTLLYPF